MFQKIPQDPAKRAERLIKRHLSASVRNVFLKDILICLVLIIVTLLLFALTIIPPFEPQSDWPILTYYIPVGAIATLVLIITILQFIYTFQHFRAIRTAESTWTEYSYLLTATPDQLQGKLHTAQTALDRHNFNISTLRKEQNHLREEYEKEIANLDRQIQTEEKLINLENLNTEIALLKAISALRKPPHV